MNIEYIDIKDGAFEFYEDIYKKAKYPLKGTFFAYLNEFSIHDTYDSSEEICIYITFALMLIEKDEDFIFLIEPLKEKLEKITDEQLQKEIEDPNDIKLLKEDLEKLKPYLQ